ncbi:MAG: amidohydrolase family protein [Propionibacteriaceae bacterium]
MTDRPLHLHGVVLPSGEDGDLWIAEGVVRTEPVAGATTLTRRGWILPGLVDAHGHIGLGPGGGTTEEVAAGQALAQRDSGVLLIRSPGAPVDTRWVDDRADLPRLIRAGRHIARPRRYTRNFAEEVEPDGLVAAVERQVAAGDGWIKLVADWVDRDLGDLAPLWPKAELSAAIDRAHALGARVTAHIFGEDGLEDLLLAGVDCIEHGTGLTDRTLAQMVERGVALVPTLLQIANFESFAAAGEAKFPRYAAHMRDLHARHLDTFRGAVEAGVAIYAGSDAGGEIPHGRLADEIVRLGEIGDAEHALGAGSWRAREWLGHPGELVDGAPADLVVLAEDPRVDLRAVRHPAHVILRGRLVP